MIEWWGPVIDEYYAATEGGGTIVYADEWLEHPGTVGRAWPNAEIVILDDDGNELGPDETGTVYMHMATGNFEYYKDKEKTDRSRHGQVLHRRRHRVPRRRRLAVPAWTARPT